MWFNSATAVILGISLGVILLVCYLVWLPVYIYAVKKGIYKERKKVIISLEIVIAVIGVISACLCVIARVTGQPYYVWYPFMMLGWFGCFWAAFILFMHKRMKKHIIKGELNKMNVDDL